MNLNLKVRNEMIKEKLSNQKKGFERAADPSVVRAFNEFQDELETSRKAKDYLQEGDLFPDFKLVNAVGDEVSLSNKLLNGPLVISFYRGTWCPYCNIELMGYEAILNDIKAAGGDFLAISPELPDLSMSLKERKNLSFEVLSDQDNQLAEQLGIVFEVGREVLRLYNGFGIDLEQTQGNEKNRLPIPATYVIDENRKIKLAYVDVDYTKRFEPSEVIKFL